MRKLVLKSLIPGIVSLLMFSFFITSCAKRSQPSKIAFVVTTMSNPYFVEMINGANAEARKDSSIQLVVQAPDKGATDVEGQVRIVEDLITARVGVICVVPADSRSILPAIADANRAGIPVIDIDNKIDTALAEKEGVHVACYIGSDNYLGGKLAAEYIVRRLNGRGNVAILEGVSGVDAAIQRKSGFVDYVKKYPGIKIVASQPADWDREKGLNVFQDMMQAHPNINALFASNDEMALGAIEAIKTAQKTGKIIVVGFDATKDGLAAVSSGTMAATVQQLPSEMGRLGVQTAVELLEGKSVPTSVPTAVKLVTK